MSLFGYRARKFLLHNVLHADDTPHTVALGVGLATWVAFLPLVGLQTVISIGLSTLFRANKVVGVPIVWITNPLTIVPIYGACFALGRFVMPFSSGDGSHKILSDLKHLAETGSLLEAAFWRDLFGLLASMGLELWVGCMIVGVFFGITSYALSRWGVSAYRERRRQKILRRNLFRASRKSNPGQAA